MVVSLVTYKKRTSSLVIHSVARSRARLPPIEDFFKDVLLTRSSLLAFYRYSSRGFHRYHRLAWHRANTIHDNVSWFDSASCSYVLRLAYGRVTM